MNPKNDPACRTGIATIVALDTALAAARKADSVIEAADAAIAAIALESGFSVATRDVSPFLATGVNDINPWEDQE